MVLLQYYYNSEVSSHFPHPSDPRYHLIHLDLLSFNILDLLLPAFTSDLR